MPLNERSPMIRRQSVSRPDLWPHAQVDDPRQIRNFMRSSRSSRSFDPAVPIPPDLSSARREPFGGSGTSGGPHFSSQMGSASDSGGKPLSSITEGAVKLASAEFTKSTLETKPDPPPLTNVESTRTSHDPPSGRQTNVNSNGVVPKLRRSKRSTKPRQI